MSADVGKIVIAIGVIIVLIGVLIYFFGSRLNWIGNLPGDIRIEREGFKFYFPLGTMILFSLLLTVILGLLKNLFR